jgi:hypothetical protein
MGLSNEGLYARLPNPGLHLLFPELGLSQLNLQEIQRRTKWDRSIWVAFQQTIRRRCDLTKRTFIKLRVSQEQRHLSGIESSD